MRADRRAARCGAAGCICPLRRTAAPCTHMKWGSASLPTPTIRFYSGRCHPTSSRPAFLAISGPQNEILRHDPEQSGGGLVGPLSGAGRTWKALHHLFLRLSKHSLPKRWTAFPVPDRVRLNSWESLRSVIRLSTDFFVNPTVLFWLVLQPPLMSRRSDVSVVRWLKADMKRPDRQAKSGIKQLSNPRACG